MMKGYGKMAIRSKQIEPLTKDYSRMPEQGRIRFGVKTDRAMKFIETFRFTSPDKEAITDIANYYGGEVKRWFDEKATPKSQWEVITLVNELTVLLHNYKSLPYDCNDIEFECLNDFFNANPYDGNILVSKKMNLTNRICFTIIEEQLNEYTGAGKPIPRNKAKQLFVPEKEMIRFSRVFKNSKKRSW